MMAQPLRVLGPLLLLTHLSAVLPPPLGCRWHPAGVHTTPCTCVLAEGARSLHPSGLLCRCAWRSQSPEPSPKCGQSEGKVVGERMEEGRVPVGGPRGLPVHRVVQKSWHFTFWCRFIT